MDNLKDLMQIADLTPEEMQLIISETSEKTFKKGERIFGEGTEAFSLFIIKEGTVEILKKTESGAESGITELKKGCIMGEMSFFKEGSLRTATAVASEEVKLIELQNKQTDLLMEKYPKLGAKIYRAIAIDMSQKLKATTQNLVLLIESSRMTALGEMTTNIAHEINNPLSIIANAAECLKEELTTVPVNHETCLKRLASIRNNALKAGKIIKGIKTVMRNGELDEKQKIKLDDIYQDVRILSEERFRTSGIRFIYENKTPELIVHCSSAQISQVLINLLNNACDAIAGEPDRWIKLSVHEFPKKVEIRITDCGKGIPPHILTNLFKPFFTSKAVGKGTGLGLNISQRIMKSQGGNLEVDASCSNTCFIMTLPK